MLNEFPVISQTFVTKEIIELSRQGHSVTVVTSRRGQGVIPQGIKVLVLAEISALKSMCHWVQLGLTSPTKFLRYTRALAVTNMSGAPWSFLLATYFLSAGKSTPDAVHSHFANRAASVGRVIAETLQIPRSVTTHAADIYTRSKYFRRHLEGARVATVTEYNQDILRELGFPRTYLIRCGVDIGPLTPESTTKREPNHVVSVGRLVPKKGHDVLIRAIANLRKWNYDVRCTIVGTGPEERALRDLIESFGLSRQIQLVGAKSHTETLALLQSASVFALACRRDATGDTDGLPVAYLEAAAAGTPIVGTQIAGIGEFLTEETGWIALPEDVEGTADAILSALTNKPETTRKAENAVATVENSFSVPSQVQGLLTVLGDPSPMLTPSIRRARVKG